MAVVFIADQGSSLCKRGDRLLVFKGPNLLRWFHTIDLQQLIIVGNIAITSQVLSYLLRNRIDTVFLSYYGKYKGRLIGEFGKNVFLRHAQFKYLEERSNRELLARCYVLGKIANMRTHLVKRKKRVNNPLLYENCIRLSAIYDKLEIQSCDLDSIRGFEGIATRNYFSAFSTMITTPDFVFKGRNRRPPQDEVNALLSLGYTFLMNQVMTATYICGLDPYMGALHEISYGRQSLVLDLMEEFRPLIDNLIITLINRKEIRLEHFSYNKHIDNEFSEETDERFLPVSMTQDGMKVYLPAFTKLLNTKLKSTSPSGEWLLKDIMINQSRKLIHAFEKAAPYEAFLWQ